MDRTSINAIGDLLKTIRAPDEAGVVVSLGAHAGSDAAPDGSITATITRGNDIATGHAVALQDALWIARMKLNDMAAKREAEKAKGKIDERA